jgi:amino acid/peptide:H+ symporter
MAFGHPKGLITLFFTEMWERLAFYTMIGILLLYTTDIERGGLGLSSAQGNEIYGLYLAFVYFTPFLGGMIADRFLGYRRAVTLGGLLMAAGLFMMGMPGFTFFVMGIVCLVVGNGFFKPNISVMVGNLYEPGDPKRDAGFNIFYMGINIGALAATLIVAPMTRNEFGWPTTFRAAGVGVMIAVVMMILNWKSLAKADRQPELDPEDTGFGQVIGKIIAPALVIGFIGYSFATWAEFSLVRPAVCGFLAGMIPILVFFVRLGVKARPSEKAGLLALLPIYVAGGAFFMILHLNGSAMTQWARDQTNREAAGPAKALTMVLSSIQQDALPSYYVNAAEDVLRPDPRSLLIVSEERIARMYGQQRMDEAAVDKIDSMPGIEVIEIAQDGSTDGTWAARSAAVYPTGVVDVVEGTDAHGAPSISISIPDGVLPDRKVTFLRRVEGEKTPMYLVNQDSFDSIYDTYRERYGHEPELMRPGQFLTVINAEVYQSWNPLFVIILTPLVVGFFTWRVTLNKTVPTARKLLYGMLFTTAALLLMAVAGMMTHNGTLKISGLWLAGFYLIVTLGELCLSPMGLSLVTKLTPKRLVGLTMGGWFVAVAFGNNFSGFFGGIQSMMQPAPFFLLLAGLAGLVSLFLFLILPRLDAAIKQHGA